MSAYLGVGKVDSYRTTDVRGVLAPLTEFAAAKQIFVLGILHFNKKTDVEQRHAADIATASPSPPPPAIATSSSTTPRTSGGCS